MSIWRVTVIVLFAAFLLVIFGAGLVWLWGFSKALLALFILVCLAMWKVTERLEKLPDAETVKGLIVIRR